MNDKSLSSPVAKIYDLGEKYIRVREWPNYLERFGLTREHVLELTKLLDFDCWTEEPEAKEKCDEKKLWAPVHAWRALAQLGGPDVVDPLLNVLHMTDMLETNWLDDELPEALAVVGPSALPQLAAFLSDRSHGLWAKVGVVNALAKIGQQHPHVREECIQVLEEALAEFKTNDEELNSFIIYALSQLKAAESAPLVKSVYDSDRVDLLLMGDYQDFEIAVGMRKKKDRAPDEPLPIRSQHRVERKRAKRRKMEKQSRRQQRKSKKNRKRRRKRK
jgi:hypothetical protein